MRALLTLCLPALVLVAACAEGDPVLSHPGPQQYVELDETVTLALGEEAVVSDASLRVRFTEVVEDSRCPLGAQCVWEGRARVALLVTQRSVEHAVTLHAPPGSPRAVELGGYRVEVQALTPEPVLGDPTDAAEYRLVLRAVAAD